jgi:hypothetical protein
MAIKAREQERKLAVTLAEWQLSAFGILSGGQRSWRTTIYPPHIAQGWWVSGARTASWPGFGEFQYRADIENAWSRGRGYRSEGGGSPLRRTDDQSPDPATPRPRDPRTQLALLYAVAYRLASAGFSPPRPAPRTAVRWGHDRRGSFPSFGRFLICAPRVPVARVRSDAAGANDCARSSRRSFRRMPPLDEELFPQPATGRRITMAKMWRVH